MGEITIHAVDGIEFAIEKGEFVVIVGPSGAVKTTVLKMWSWRFRYVKILWMRNMSSKIIGSFVHLRNRLSGEQYVLGEDEVLVTEKLANLLGVSVGDTLFLKKSEQEKYPVIVGGIGENYLHHYVYMCEGLYRKVYGESPEYNTLFLNHNDRADEELARDLVSFDYVNSVTFIDTLRGQIKDMMDSLNVVIWVLIFSAELFLRYFTHLSLLGLSQWGDVL